MDIAELGRPAARSASPDGISGNTVGKAFFPLQEVPEKQADNDNGSDAPHQQGLSGMPERVLPIRQEGDCRQPCDAVIPDGHPKRFAEHLPSLDPAVADGQQETQAEQGENDGTDQDPKPVRKT